MKLVGAAAREVLGLFVDEGSLPLALIAWTALVVVVLRHLPGAHGWLAPVFAAGCLGILVENVGRSVRR